MTVSEQIIQVIDALCEKFGIAINWTSENVIPYIETLCGKLITYEISTSIVWIVIMVLTSVASIIATKKLAPIFKRGIERQSTYEIGWSVFSIFAVIALVIVNLSAIGRIIDEAMDIIKCATFPEMYIFEYVSTLMPQ